MLNNKSSYPQLPDGINMMSSEKLLESFSTAAGADKGTGLDLSMDYESFRYHENQYLLKEVPYLLSKKTILLVEDEKAILTTLKILLEKKGFTVLGANTPGLAIRIACEYDGEIHLLISDVEMPEMNGCEMYKNLHKLYPDMKSIFMSGYNANIVSHHGITAEDTHFLQKPFSSDELAIKVKCALN
ncbi:MAG: response regulator [bacterium]